VQASAKYGLAIIFEAAIGLGLEVLPTSLAQAEKVIE
jgi:hypothetical protein